jgi:Cyclic nucleotide-binding domain
MSTFIAGIGMLGPSRASIVSAVQPALTPVIGLAVFGDSLGPLQLLGGALVVASVVIIEAGRRAPESLLSLLPRRERRMLTKGAVAFDVPAGRRLVHEGALPGPFFLIERGRARVTRDARPVAHLGPGDCFGELALLRGGARTASVEAATDMRVRVVSRPEFTRAIATLPTLARLVHRLAHERLVIAPQPNRSCTPSTLWS